MKSAALNRSSRKYPERLPAKLLVPDLVTTLTCTPLDRPWVASNRALTNSNSAIASRLNFGSPHLAQAMLEVTCCPSTLIWKKPPWEPLGDSVTALTRLPGASIVSSIQFRPFKGVSCICFGSMLPATCDDVTSIAPTFSCTSTVVETADGFSWISMRAL